MSSNGSTSMASTCGSTLALMDAGVPITAPVAGAAMGLISEPDGRFVVLTDILGKEDSVGDMDFKVTGTRDGVTALQMDIKVKGINEAIIREGLKQALAARLEILDKMTAVMPRPAGDERLRAAHHHDQDQPRQDPRDHRQGGSMIRKIQERPRPRSTSRTTARSRSPRSPARTPARRSLDREPDPRGRDRRALPRQGHPDHGFGAFVEILPGKEGLVRIGELADYHVPSVEDVVAVGDEVMVVVTEVDRQGRINLSRKAAMARHLAKDPVA
jgi:polyribonucleotide nucleotidyltransferase